MSAEDDITDAMTRHQIFVLRYARGREREAEQFIAETMEKAIARLSGELTEFQRERLQTQIRDLYEYLIAAHSEYAEGFRSQMSEFMTYETEYASKTMGAALKVEMTAPAATQVQQSIFANVMQLEPRKGYTIADAMSEFGRKNADKITTLVREGVVLGKSAVLARGLGNTGGRVDTVLVGGVSTLSPSSSPPPIPTGVIEGALMVVLATSVLFELLALSVVTLAWSFVSSVCGTSCLELSFISPS